MDMFRYGMVAEDKDGVGMVRKTTKIATNAPEIADALSLRCSGGHRHVHLVSGRPKYAAIYPREFCRAIVKGYLLYRQRRSLGIKWTGQEGVFTKRKAEVQSLLKFERPDLCDPEEVELGGINK